MLETLKTLLAAVVLVAIGVSALRDRVASLRARLTDRPDALTQQYLDGEIDESEYERRRGFALDERNERIQAVVEDVPGISEARSKAIAREYDSLDDLRASDRERLEGVYGVGEETAEAVLERVN